MVFSIDTLWFFLISILSGVVAGMGMGGGTLLIPMLTILMKVDHTLAQATNLLVFVPVAIVVIIIYSKDKLVDFKHGWIVALPAAAVSVVAALVAIRLDSEVLSFIFGAFIALIGLVQIIIFIIKKIQAKRTT